MPKYPYRDLGTGFDRDFRNDLNANFDDIEQDFRDVDARMTQIENDLDARIDNIVADAGSSNTEIVDARYDSINNVTYPTLKDRLDDTSDKIGNLNKKTDGIVNVKEFGAIGDGVTDDTLAIQAAIDFIKNTYGSKGGTVIFPHGTYKFSEVLISSKHVRLTGNGTLKGTIKVKGVENADPNTNNIPDMFTVIEGLRFVHDWGNNTNAIVFQNMRGATVSNCYFENYAIAIHGESIREDIPYHQTSRVVISDCKFRNVDYAVRTTWMPYHENVPPTWRYNQHGDWQIKGCQAYFYSRGITHFHFEGQDGLVCTNNILFHSLYSEQSQTKKHNIYLKQSNFAVISNNDLFEAGYESILCEDYRSLIITGNNIAWPGQREPKSGIFVETIDTSTYAEASCIIADNNISYPTGHGIFVGYKATNCKVSNNTITKIGSNNFYYGTTDLSSVTHYAVFVGDPNPTFPEQNRVVVSNNFYDGIIYQNRGVAEGNFPFAFVDVNRTFGNINTTTRDITGTLDLSTIITRNSNPFNDGFPFILKNVTGTISQITGAKLGQILTIICGSGSLTLNNSGTGTDQLNIGSNVTLNQSQSITLQKTDTYWIRI
jgi:parallel beta-helix repeat protein